MRLAVIEFMSIVHPARAASNLWILIKVLLLLRANENK